MNKFEIIAATHERLQHPSMTADDVTETIEAFLEVLSDAVASGETVRWKGFGEYRQIERSERIFTNPKTQERQIISAKKVIKFVPEKRLEEVEDEHFVS